MPPPAVLQLSTIHWECQMSKKLLVGVSAAVLVASMAGIAVAKHRHHDGYHGSHGYHKGHCKKGGKHHGRHHGKRWGKKFSKMSALKNADTNKDGTITKAELEAAQKVKFEKFDKDKNGEVTKEEVLARIARHLEKRAERITRRFDTNKDGKVTVEEFQARADRQLYMLDLNDDGQINKDEMPRWLRHAGKRHKHKRGADKNQEVKQQPETETENTEQQ